MRLEAGGVFLADGGIAQFFKNKSKGCSLEDRSMAKLRPQVNYGRSAYTLASEFSVSNSLLRIDEGGTLDPWLLLASLGFQLAVGFNAIGNKPWSTSRFRDLQPTRLESYIWTIRALMGCFVAGSSD